MKSVERNDRGRFDGRSAEQYIENVLQNNRSILSGKHNPERSRARAMEVLAASAVPAVESAGASWASSTVAKLGGTKGIIGVVAAAAVAGGIGLAVLSSEAPQQHRPAPSTAPLVPQTAPPLSVEGQLQPMHEPERRPPTVRLESPASASTAVRTDANGSAAIEEEEKKTTQDAAATSSASATSRQTVEDRNSANTTMRINPVTTTKK